MLTLYTYILKIYCLTDFTLANQLMVPMSSKSASIICSLNSQILN